jgi:uncharacterized protein
MITQKEWDDLKKRASSGIADAEWEVGSIYDEGAVDDTGNIIANKNKRQALFWYRRAAEHGSPSGQLCLGYCFDTGRGVKQNKEEALKWYKKAFKNGEASAAINIAIVYKEHGNNRRSFFWYSRAAEMNDGDAIFEIAQMHYRGKGVKKNYSLAIEGFRQAIENKNVTESSRRDAMYYLGVAYLEGKGVESSISQAKQLFKEANYDGEHQLAKEKLHQLLQ